MQTGNPTDELNDCNTAALAGAGGAAASHQCCRSWRPRASRPAFAQRVTTFPPGVQRSDRRSPPMPRARRGGTPVCRRAEERRLSGCPPMRRARVAGRPFCAADERRRPLLRGIRPAPRPRFGRSAPAHGVAQSQLQSGAGAAPVIRRSDRRGSPMRRGLGVGGGRLPASGNGGRAGRRAARRTARQQ